MTETTRHGFAGSDSPSAEPDELKVRIQFHGPFRIGTGHPGFGLNEVVDREDPLPASSLKGLMRASAAQLLPEARALINRVFGAGRQPSPWYWYSAVFAEQPRVRTRARIRVDSDTGTAERNHLFVAEEHWAEEAEFTVSRAGRLSPAEEKDHRTLLACAAAGVHALGGDRRRGYGWVTCTPVQPALDEPLLAHFEQLRTRQQWEKGEARA